MKKREQKTAKIDEYLERFRKISSETLVGRYNNGYTKIKEASIAIHRVLEERGELRLLNGEPKMNESEKHETEWSALDSEIT